MEGFLTVTRQVAVVLPAVIEMMAEPGLQAVITPSLSTTATLFLLLLKETGSLPVVEA